MLAYALQQTWGYREGRRLTVAAYQATGGIDGAIARAADAVYARLDADGKLAAQRLLLRLVSLGEGSADTRRRATMTELTGSTDGTGPARTPRAAAERAALTALIQARLLTTDTGADGSDTVTISHEALLTAWPQLREWLSQDRARPAYPARTVRRCRGLASAAARSQPLVQWNPPGSRPRLGRRPRR